MIMNNYNKQLFAFTNIAAHINGDLTIINTHTSKDEKLPVVKIDSKAISFTIRDNFHSINLGIELKEDFVFPYAYFYKHEDIDWYNNEILRKKGYTFDGWTEEEINDLRILRVFVKNRYWSEVSGAEKDRWLNRDKSTEWYHKDWSSTTLIEFRGMFFKAEYAFCEGMRDFEHLQPYVPGMTKFVICVDSYKKLEEIIRDMK